MLEENSSGKIELNKTGEGKILRLFPFQEKWKTNLIKIWILLWTICGMVVLAEIFSAISREQKLFLAIYLVFWFYFELKMFRVIKWRTSGVEIVELKRDKLVYEKNISGKGFPTEIKNEDIIKVSLSVVSPTSFAAVFNNSYWLEGAETILIETKNKKMGLGLQLTKKDSEKILKEITRHLEKNRTITP